jgi:hypothetical protein
MADVWRQTLWYGVWYLYEMLHSYAKVIVKLGSKLWPNFSREEAEGRPVGSKV